MVKVNLASRPFYNERLVTLALVALGLVAVGLTTFNVAQLVRLSAKRTAQQSAISRDEAAARTADQDAVSLNQSVDRSTLNLLAAEAGEANGLINERTFSWTTFFGLIEKAMPQNVHLVSVAPRDTSGVTWITMVIIAKRAEDEADLMDALEGTGAFFDVQPRSEDATDDGMLRTIIRARYLEPPTAPATTAAKGGRP
jgi:hypothetical protein